MQNIIISLCIGLITASSVFADANSAPNTPQPIILQDWQSVPFISVSDPTVIAAANFATQRIKNGSLYKVVFAQQQQVSAGNIYILTIELVDIHFKHNRYSAQIFIPSVGNDWQLVYFTPVQY